MKNEINELEEIYKSLRDCYSELSELDLQLRIKGNGLPENYEQIAKVRNKINASILEITDLEIKKIKMAKIGF